MRTAEDYAVIAGIVVGLPLLIVGLLAWASRWTAARDVFACRRCEATFERRPDAGLAGRCPRCGARDWRSYGVRT